MGYTGTGGVWAMKAGDFVGRNFPGTQAGIDAAVTYVGSNGFVQIGPGLDGLSPTSVPASGVSIVRADSTGWVVLGKGITTGRLGPSSGSTWGGAIRIVDGVTFPATGAGIQSALDEVRLAGGGEVVAPSGAYTLTSPLRVGTNSVMTGLGRGATVLRASAAFSGTAMVMPYDTTGAQQWFSLRDIELDGNSGAGAVVARGVLVKGVGQPTTLSSVHVHDVSGVGIWREGVSSNYGPVCMYNVNAAHCGGDGIYVSAKSSGTIMISTNVQDPGSSAAGVHIEGPDATGYLPNDVIIEGLLVESLSSGETGLWLDDVQGASVDGVEYAGSGGVGTLVKITGSSSTTRAIRLSNIAADGSSLATVIDDQVYSRSWGNTNRAFIPLWTTDKGSASRIDLVNASIDSLAAHYMSGKVVVQDSLRANLGITTSGDVVVSVPGNEIKYNDAGGAYVWNVNAGGPLNLGARGASTAFVVGSSGNFVKSTWPVIIGTLTFATLGTPADGTMAYCSDCTKATPTAGGGTGALVVRINGAWDGNP